jgi:hypothetical protein
MNMNQKKMEAAIQSKAMHGKKRSKPEKKRWRHIWNATSKPQRTWNLK